MNNIKFPKKNTKKIRLIGPIYILFITTIIALTTSSAKFGKVNDINSGAIVAIPIFSSTTIDLEKIYPDMETLKYDIAVQNSKNSTVSQTSLDYIITITNIGNVPLNIELYKKENGLIVGDNLLDNGSTPAFSINTEEIFDYYEVHISWDKSIENYKSYEYSSETSCVEIKIEAIQKD